MGESNDNGSTVMLSYLVKQMRELGITKYKTDTIELELGPEAQASPPPHPEKKEESDEDVDEREWNKRWRLATRSSGVAPPPYPRRKTGVTAVK